MVLEITYAVNDPVLALPAKTSPQIISKRKGNTLPLIGSLPESRIAMNDEALVNNTLQDTTQLLPISRKPVFCKVVCSNSGIPRHEDEHRRLQEWQRGAIPDNPGLHTGGFGWGNIGMNDMISESQRMTATFLAGSAFSACTHQPEFVYF